jgi:hypothetical protein
MFSSSVATRKNQPSTPPRSAIKPESEAQVDPSTLVIDEAGIRLLIDFFLQLQKWDTLQSTRIPAEAPPSAQDIAA